jgi:hypothetical protein
MVGTMTSPAARQTIVAESANARRRTAAVHPSIRLRLVTLAWLTAGALLAANLLIPSTLRVSASIPEPAVPTVRWSA